VLKYLSVIFEIRAFLKHLIGGNFEQSPHIFLQTRHLPCPSKRSFSTTERDDIRPQSSKYYWSVSSRFILSLLSKSDEKDLHEITVV